MDASTGPDRPLSRSGRVEVDQIDLDLPRLSEHLQQNAPPPRARQRAGEDRLQSGQRAAPDPDPRPEREPHPRTDEPQGPDALLNSLDHLVGDSDGRGPCPETPVD